mmetsp:Transcript_27090/g.43557  ORF Transcript_27090/g.43557 Transcript_27090/m.43557 type:complete len:760 (+) Transcript_27090:82-2361(+)
MLVPRDGRGGGKGDDDLPTSRVGRREAGRRKAKDQATSKGNEGLPWNQEVTDARGRRRFHGAFTGGFSAGYFNTVGSKEGWKPRQFVSSRSKRADKNKARPEDFMDAEDLAQAAQAGKTMVMQTDFAGQRDRVGGKRGSASRKSSEFEGMLTVKTESIGRQLLRTMGWREGKDIGEDSAAAAKGPKKKVYGVSLPPPGHGKSISQPKKRFHKHTGVYITTMKDDLRGLGFKGHADVLAPPPSLASKTVRFGSGHVSSNSGLGLGALEKAGKFDDYYTATSMEEYDIDIDVKTATTKSSSSAADHVSSSRGSRQRQHGTMKGLGQQIESLSFVRAVKEDKMPTNYPPISVPKDFNGVHRFQHDQVVIAENIRKLDATQHFLHGRDGSMSIEQRRRILGEKKLPGPAPPKILEENMSKEVIDLISEKDREKLAKSLESAFTTAGKSYKCIEDPNAWKKQFEQVDPLKQKRFERFLQVMAGDKSSGPIPRHNLTGWQYQREMEEFRAIYDGKFKPGAQNFKETGRRGLDPEKDCKAAAKLRMYGHLTRMKEPWVPDRLLCLRFNVPNPYKDKPLPQSKRRGTKSQRQYQETLAVLQGSQARRKNRIKGPSMLSRTSTSALQQGKGISFVAKAVFDPSMGTTTSMGGGQRPAGLAGSSSSSSMSKSADWNFGGGGERNKGMAVSGAAKTNAKKEEDDDDEETAAPIEKPKIDLFKAIFDDEGDDGVSSDDDDDEDEEEEKEEEEEEWHKCMSICCIHVVPDLG